MAQTPDHSLGDHIDEFFTSYTKSHEKLVTEHDPEWLSPCEVGQPWRDEHNIQQICWQPVRRHSSVEDFFGLQNALELNIHPDIKTHYARYWSATLHAEAPQGHVSLMYLWNQQDVDRLIENLIGHALACKQNKTPFSVFFACTDEDSDLYLTVNNQSGEVQLEQPGKQPIRVVAPSLSMFMQQLAPSPTTNLSSA